MHKITEKGFQLTLKQTIYEKEKLKRKYSKIAINLKRHYKLASIQTTIIHT